MAIAQVLTKILPRENSGSNTSDRFEYQKNWALCTLIDLHENKDNYTIGFECYDDVAVFDDALNPSTLHFYQVKTTKRNNWSITKLTTSKKGKNGPLLSFIGKLYDHIDKFGNNVTTINFVSNKPYNITLEDKTQSLIKSNFCVNTFSKENLKKVSDCVLSEFSSPYNTMFEDITYLIKSNLSLEDHKNSTMGKIAIFLEKINSGKYSVPLIYKTLSDEIRRKNDYCLETNFTFADLVKYKCITRRDFEKNIEVFVKSSKEVSNRWTAIENRLLTDGFNFMEVKKMKSSYLKYDIDSLSSNAIIETLLKKIIASYDKFNLTGQLTGSIRECLDQILHEYNKDPIIDSYLDESYIKLVILDTLINYEEQN